MQVRLTSNLKQHTLNNVNIAEDKYNITLSLMKTHVMRTCKYWLGPEITCRLNDICHGKSITN